jgi:hypothetical protein
MPTKKEKKLKILAASDFHGMDIVSKDLAKRAEKEKVDLVVIAGDVLHFGEYAKNMIKPFIDKKLPVLFVPGNHDPPEAVENFMHDYRVKNLNGSSFIFEDAGFFGSGGSTHLPHFPFHVTEKETYQALKKGYEKIRATKKKIMVTHEHPAKSMLEKFSGVEGSESIRKAIDSFHPDIHICGHIHEMEGFEEKIGRTRVFSVGTRGMIIEV